MNVPFAVTTGVLIAYLAGRSFAGTGAPGLLLLGCGSLFWAASPVAAGGVGNFNDFNHRVTVPNLSVVRGILLLAGRGVVEAAEVAVQ